jgi:hypothetical protein
MTIPQTVSQQIAFITQYAPDLLTSAQNILKIAGGQDILSNIINGVFQSVPSLITAPEPTPAVPDPNNALEPVDQLLNYLAQNISTQQPTEAQLLQGAQDYYDPYFNKREAQLKEYYDMQRRQAQASYSAAAASVAMQQRNLQQQYQIYMEEIQTGKLRAGSDEQKIRERALQDKQTALDGLKTQQQSLLTNLQKSYISREGLYSGSRQNAQNLSNQNYNTNIQGVETATARTTEDAATKYQRAMEDYLLEEKKAKANLSSGSGSLAGAGASMNAQIEEANYAQKIKEQDLQDQRQQALMNYVYGPSAYSYLGL